MPTHDSGLCDFAMLHTRMNVEPKSLVLRLETPCWWLSEETNMAARSASQREINSRILKDKSFL